MKKIILLLFFYCSFVSAFSQEFVPKESYMNTNLSIKILYQFKFDKDCYHIKTPAPFQEIPKKEIIGIEHFFAYSHSLYEYRFYFYTTNVIGYYSSVYPPRKLEKAIYKYNLKRISSEDDQYVFDVLKSLSIFYRSLNQPHLRYRDELRERFVKDSLETARKREIELEAKRAEYRKNHDWHVPTFDGFLYCDSLVSN